MPAEFLAEGLQDMRIKQALLITALIRLGGTLEITRQDAHEASKHDMTVTDLGDRFRVGLRPAPSAD